MIPYGFCSTEAKTVAKTVTVSPSITELTTGLTIAVRFQYANTATNPTLNVNSLGAKSIYRYGSTVAGTSAAASWNAQAVVTLTYNGSAWMLNDFNNTTYSALSATDMETGTATTARLITAQRLKQAVEYHAPVTSVNGQTGDVTVSGGGGVETDPVFSASAASGITSTDITNWNDKSDLHNLVDGQGVLSVEANTLVSATGDSSVALGFATTASGTGSIAVGQLTKAIGKQSVAMGYSAEASGDNSVAAGLGAKASAYNQVAIGEYNAIDSSGSANARGDYALIIGNGVSYARSNALTVDWNGNVEMALDTTATSGTDKDIYDALVALGWDSDVIV